MIDLVKGARVNYLEIQKQDMVNLGELILLREVDGIDRDMTDAESDEEDKGEDNILRSRPRESKQE